MIGAQERWRELRAQGAQIDAAARGAPPTRHLEAVREATSAVKPLGLVWVLSPSCVVLYAGRTEEGCLEGMGRIRELYPGVPLLVLGSQLDLALTWAALKNGADGFVHAQMDPAQVVSAVEVVQRGGHNDAGARSRCLRERPSRARKDWTLSFLSPIHASAWKGNSQKFACNEFYAVCAALV